MRWWMEKYNVFPGSISTQLYVLPRLTLPPVQKNLWFSLETRPRNSLCLAGLSILIGLQISWDRVGAEPAVKLDWKLIQFM